MAWTRLLVPHDFSECAARALALAVDLAEQHGAGITVMHATTLPENLDPAAMLWPAGGVAPVRAEAYAVRAALARVEEVIEPLRARGLDVRPVAVVSDVADAILETASSVGADAIVMGTHGRTGLAHLLLGSVAEKVVRRAPVPVVTTRSPSPEVAHAAFERALEDELAG